MARKVFKTLPQDDTEELPAQLQSIYTQLIDAINSAIQRLCNHGARPIHISDEFLEEIIQEMLHQRFTRQELQERVDGEFLHQILVNAKCKSVC